MKSLETNFIQLEYSRPFNSRIDAIEFYKNQGAKELPSSNKINPLLLIAGFILLVGIRVYIQNQKSKEKENV